jgi:nitroreductase
MECFMRSLLSVSLFILALSFHNVYAQDNKESLKNGAIRNNGGLWTLPKPRQTGGMPLLSALAARQSNRSFADKPLPEQLLSDLLWAAFGINRPDSGKRTAPSSYNWQDITIYVFSADGVWTYEPKAHALTSVKQGDHRKLAGLQSFVWTAPLSLVYVSDTSKMHQDDQTFSEDYKLKIGAIDAGHISQNVYLFCASEGLGVVARASVDAKAFSKAFNLPPHKLVLLGQTVGFPQP